jgi:hypothetical protein
MVRHLATGGKIFIWIALSLAGCATNLHRDDVRSHDEKTQDLQSIYALDEKVFSVLKQGSGENIDLEDSILKVSLLYEEKFAYKAFHDYYRRLENFFFALPRPIVIDDKRNFSNTLKIARYLVDYYQLEDLMGANLLATLDDPAFAKKYRWQSGEDYEEFMLIRAKAYRLYGAFSKARAALDLIKPKAKTSSPLRKHCRYFLEEVDLHIRQVELREAEKLLDRLLTTLPVQDDHRKCRFWAQYDKSVISVYENKFDEALSINAKNFSYGQRFDVDRPQVQQAKIYRLTGRGKQAVEVFSSIRERTFKSVWTMSIIYIFGEKMIASIYAGDKAAYLESVSKMQPLLDARKDLKTHDSLFKAWIVLGRHVVMGEKLNRQEIDSRLADVEPLVGANHPDVVEFKNFYKKSQL